MRHQLETERLTLIYEPDIETFDWVGGGRCGVYYLWHGEECAGAISMTGRSRGNGEIGYQLAPEYRGHGLATEALAAVIEAAPDCHGFTLLSAQVHGDNTASLRVLEKTGFSCVGRKLCWSEARSQPMAVVQFRRLAAEPTP
jgi:RimJ/RimL family protein N-acetyltransferase